LKSLRKFRIVFVALWTVALASPLRAAQTQPKPWTREQILRMLRGDVPPKHVGDLARQRGIDFQRSTEIESEIRQAASAAGNEARFGIKSLSEARP
jgi:hypothetical protein